jgi:2-C-methyl-D-erythritol 4-phosphate cytidylyltransferase/2-C-methyl-D-erythritol 2,4-cyclodiphosphate synthase
MKAGVRTVAVILAGGSGKRMADGLRQDLGGGPDVGHLEISGPDVGHLRQDLAGAHIGAHKESGRNKVLFDLAGQSILAWSLAAFHRHPQVTDILVVSRKEDLEAIRELCRRIGQRHEVAGAGRAGGGGAGVGDSGDSGVGAGGGDESGGAGVGDSDSDSGDAAKIIDVIEGGTERQDSVANAVRYLSTIGLDADDRVLIHDGARPLVTGAIIDRCLESLTHYQAAVPGVQDGIVLGTLERDQLRAVQTPQGFRFGALQQAHWQAHADGFQGTDDVSLAERIGIPVLLFEGDYRNIKVTTPEDLVVAAAYLDQKGESAMDQSCGGGASPGTFRVGIGFDVHAFQEGRPLFLGGIQIPSHMGLQGHSDADVLLHAIIDALLGAAGLNDIGRQFPDSDPKFKDVRSTELLKAAAALVKNEGYSIVNIDAVVITQQPRISSFADAMKEKIAGILGISSGQVGIKGKTTEGLGFEGRGEGITAQAVASLYRNREQN